MTTGTHTDGPRFPEAQGIHHLRVPVSDLGVAFGFWRDIFGYERDFDFPGPDGVVNWAIKSVTGGPSIVLWVDPERANNPPPYPLFSLSLRDEQSVFDLEAELDRRGFEHGEVQFRKRSARFFAYDPDRNKIGCYVRHDYVRSVSDRRKRPLPEE
ncbi:VOC family protein [Arthrobacter sp. 2MCAF15]|uniref:VOC family protein n=1 Tax=Arthrobacter sp. 2MCAF15 TaxID=3232984 RepID=UPI003F8F70B0